MVSGVEKLKYSGRGVDWLIAQVLKQLRWWVQDGEKQIGEVSSKMRHSVERLRIHMR